MMYILVVQGCRKGIFMTVCPEEQGRVQPAGQALETVLYAENSNAGFAWSCNDFQLTIKFLSPIQITHLICLQLFSISHQKCLCSKDMIDEL